MATEGEKVEEKAATTNANDEVEAKKAKALELLPLLKEELKDDLLDGTTDITLMKFLYWKLNVKRAADRYRRFVRWRKDNPWAFDNAEKGGLNLHKDPELKRVAESQFIVAPPGVTDKKGSTLAFGRLRFNDMTDGRTPHGVVRNIMYTIDNMLERESTWLHGLVIFHDMKEISKNNLHISIPKLMINAIIGHFPIRISGIYILNAPIFFRVLFKVISNLFPKKLKERTHFVESIDDIYEVIDKDLLLEEHGGKCNFDIKEWIALQCEREINGQRQSIIDNTSVLNTREIIDDTQAESNTEDKDDTSGNDESTPTESNEVAENQDETPATPGEEKEPTKEES